MKAVIFDLDGTLINTAPGIRVAVNQMLVHYDAGPLSLKTVTEFIGDGVPALVAKCLSEVGQPDTELDTAVALFNKTYFMNPCVNTEIYKGVEDLLERLMHEGWILGVCTNKPEMVARKILQIHRLDRFFSSVVGGDRLTVRKPNPAPLALCLREVGATMAKSVYFGDSDIDASTAASMSLPFYFFEGGYGGTVSGKTQLNSIASAKYLLKTNCLTD